MRQLATIRRIEEIKPIPNAEAICAYRVGGWWIVDRIGTYKVDDLAVHVEIDAWCPHEIAPFLSKGKEPRKYNGILGERLRTVRLRGQISQGLLLPIETLFPGKDRAFWYSAEGDDVAGVLGIQKWEPTLPAELVGQVVGPFPSYIPRTDSERCQNLSDEIFVQNVAAKYEVSIKLDGTSCTVFHNNGEFGVCSRNYQLKINEENANNTYVRIVHDTLLNVNLPLMGNYAVQAELIGPNIQGNKENLKQTQLYIFNVFDIDAQRYLTPTERKEFCDRLFNMSMNVGGRLFHVPIVAVSANLTDSLGITNMEQLLKFAEGPSLGADQREGLVFKAHDSNFSFKAISNRWLMKNDG